MTMMENRNRGKINITDENREKMIKRLIKDNNSDINGVNERNCRQIDKWQSWTRGSSNWER